MEGKDEAFVGGNGAGFPNDEPTLPLQQYDANNTVITAVHDGHDLPNQASNNGNVSPMNGSNGGDGSGPKASSSWQPLLNPNVQRRFCINRIWKHRPTIATLVCLHPHYICSAIGRRT
jgi:hypothetical protein